MKDELFLIKARKCKRCCRLLTSEKAVKEGYGERCRCLEKREQINQEPIPGQMSMFDLENQIDNEDTKAPE